ncbi:MAG: ABC transporter substrate-binding protein [Nitrospinota bacterium]
MSGKRIPFNLTLVLSLFLLLPAPAPGAQKFKFALPWVPFGRDSGWFSALEKGYYAEEGLDVTIHRGFGGADSIQKLVAGAYKIGTTDPGSLLLARAQGIKIVMVGMYHDKAPFVLRWLEGSGIKSLKDLEGRTVGAPPGDSNLKVLPVLMEANGVDFKKLKIVNMQPAAREPMLLSGKLDVVTGFHIQQPSIAAMAAKQGKKVKMTLFADHGVDVYGYGIIALESYMRQDPKTLRKFLRASVKGMAYSIEHPGEAVKFFLKRYPAADPKTNRQVWDLTIDGMLTEEQMRLGIWRMERKKWVKTRDVLSKGYGLKVKFAVDDLYTNDFLPVVMPPKRGPRTIPRLW